MLIVNDIFESIQGESTDTGKPCVFIRLFGCNVRCTYCDTLQTKSMKMSVEEIVSTIKHKHRRIHYVCITGGEPLIQPEVYSLIYALTGMNYKVSIETNGCMTIDSDPYNRTYKYIMDVKCPSSGVSDKNILSNLRNLHMIDEVKFVIANRKDYEYALECLRKYPTKAKILFSPMFSKNNKALIGEELVNWILKDFDYDTNVRVQIQTHKVIGVL